MGFLDALLGKSQLPQAKTEKLFAISTAAVTLETKLGLKAQELSAICLKPMESSRYEAARQEIEELLRLSTRETGSEYRVEKDEYGYLWVVLKDPDFDDLVTNIHMISQTLIEQGFGTQLLCAVYRFKGEFTVYWIYSFKQGAYYPFVPLEGQKRNNAIELRLKSLMETELPLEKEMERWYPLWGMPI
jgi:hypothetical protein